MSITIDNWQEMHTVCCVTPLIDMLRKGEWKGRTDDGPDLDYIHEAQAAAVRCDCVDDNDGEPLEDCDECSGNGETGTIYEYWVVDSYLAGLLESIGEGLFDADVIGIAGNAQVWCRTTSGQLISADWSIGAAFKLHLKAMAR